MASYYEMCYSISSLICHISARFDYTQFTGLAGGLSGYMIYWHIHVGPVSTLHPQGCRAGCPSADSPLPRLQTVQPLQLPAQPAHPAQNLTGVLGGYS
jgi:hypothetical protein